MNKNCFIAGKPVKIMGKKLSAYEGAQEPPLVFGQALVKILKASSAQLGQHGLRSSASEGACLVQNLEKQSKGFFSWPFFWCPFYWGQTFLLFWGEKHTGLPPSLQRKEEENWKLTSTLESSRDKQTSQLPQTSHALPDGAAGALRHEESKQAPSRSLPLQSRRDLPTDRRRERREESKRHLYLEDEKVCSDKH